MTIGGPGRCVGFGNAGQREQLGDVHEIGGAEILVLVLGVVIGRRQAESLDEATNRGFWREYRKAMTERAPR